MRCNEWLLRATSQYKLPRIYSVIATCCVAILLTSCHDGNAIGDLEARYPIEVESCVCRFLAFEADSYSGIQYDEMLAECNVTTRSGHPTLPPDIVSNPTQDSLRCTEAVEDWHETLAEERAQQASNRQNFKELTQTNDETDHD